MAERISYYSVAGIVTFTATVGPVGPGIPLPTMTFVFYKKSGGNWVFNFSKTVTASADGTADAATGSQIPMDFYVVVSAEATTANLASAKSNKVYMTVR